jgi:hypothetical protein
VDNSVIKSSYCNLTIGKLWSLVKLAKNWTTFLQNNFRLPETVDEAVERLIFILEDEHKAALAIMQEKDLIDLHFGLGMAIRNAFDLYVPWSKLLASCGVVHPDDASEVIISELWRSLQT